MKYKEIDGLVKGFNCLCNIHGKNITRYSRTQHFYDDWKVVKLFATNCGLLQITIEEPKEEGKKDNEQENLLHKTETNRLAAFVDQYNNTVHGQRKRDNNPTSNAPGNISDDNKGKNDGLQGEINITGGTKMTLVDRILEMMYQAYLEGEFKEQLGEYTTFDLSNCGWTYLNDCYNSDAKVTIETGKDYSIYDIVCTGITYGETVGFKNGFLIGMLFANQANSKPIIFNQPKDKGE